MPIRGQDHPGSGEEPAQDRLRLFMARQGKTGCKGRTIPMDKLDHLVADHLESRFLEPQRLETVLASVIDRRQERLSAAANTWPNSTGGSPIPTSGSAVSMTQSNPARSIRTIRR